MTLTNVLSNVTVQQLKRAIKIKSKLETLQAQFDEIIGVNGRRNALAFS